VSEKVEQTRHEFETIVRVLEVLTHVLSDLEQKARVLSAQKQKFITDLTMLKNEMLMLKGKCLEHSSCNCEAIRNYLSESVDKTSPTKAALYSQLEDKKSADQIANEIARKQI
jgi:DNA integrity scanning protein DisA with diadenylate cyclase activity